MFASSNLPVGYRVRNPTEEDIPAILNILYEYDIAESGEADSYKPEDIRSDWEDLDPETDAWVIITPDGTLSGYGTLTVEAENGHIISDGYVHPAHCGRGIGTTLIELMERRAAELVPTLPEGIRIVLENNIVATTDAARSLLERHGYTMNRVYFRMHITLDTPPQSPAWPEGISVRVCDGSEEDLHRAYETISEGFKDHWAHTPRSFEEWQSHMVREEFDPMLWFIAQDGDKIAGAALCRVREAGKGWIDQVAVLRPWRKRGLGEALLRQAFAAFYSRDVPRVGLGVDGQSLTGAQRLYERVGMNITMRIGHYEKELRSGVDMQEKQQSDLVG